MTSGAIALLGALREEVSGLRRRLGLGVVHQGPAYRLYGGAYRGAEVLLAQTGAGRDRAEAATELVLDRCRVRAVVSLGLAGALAAHLNVGDVVVCSTLRCATSGLDVGSNKDHHSDGHLLRLSTCVLRDVGVRAYIGSGVTVPRAVCTVDAKRALHAVSEADVVDMESYWVAEIASRHDVPFVEIRAISDAHRDMLPPFDRWMDAGGRWHWRAAATYLIRHPHHLAALASLAGNARLATANLTSVVEGLVIAIGGQTCARS